MDYEVVIVGGASAGLSAALALGRSARKTIVFDSGNPRNKPASHAHNLFTRDGTPPLDLLKIAKEQLEQYTAVSFQHGSIKNIRKEDGRFLVTADNDQQLTSRRIILATGLSDVLPDIKGFRQLWGRKIIHCPYCHGWEAKGKPMGLLMNGSVAEHMVTMVYQLNKELHLFTNGPSEISAEAKKWMEERNIAITEQPLTALVDDKDGLIMQFSDGTQRRFSAVYARADRYQFHNELAIQLGCKLTEEGAVAVDEAQTTSVTGVYAVGDLAHPTAHQVIMAAASGTKAGIACNNGLIMEDYDRWKEKA